MAASVHPQHHKPDLGGGYQVAITGCGFRDDHFVLQYSLSPVPDPLAGDQRHHEGDDPGIVVDSQNKTYRSSRSAYRVAADGQRVVGAIRFGPAVWPSLGVFRVLFAPLAHTPGLHERLCEVRLTVDADKVRTTRVRRRRTSPW
jgi:hypothetical protein